MDRDTLKVGIVGSRKFGDLSKVSKFIRILHKIFGDQLIIVSGGAAGVDKTAEYTARELGIEPIVHQVRQEPGEPFPAAAYRRNSKIIEDSDLVVAFWDLESRGTLDSIKKAERVRKLAAIITRIGVYRNEIGRIFLPTIP